MNEYVRMKIGFGNMMISVKLSSKPMGSTERCSTLVESFYTLKNYLVRMILELNRRELTLHNPRAYFNKRCLGWRFIRRPAVRHYVASMLSAQWLSDKKSLTGHHRPILHGCRCEQRKPVKPLSLRLRPPAAPPRLEAAAKPLTPTNPPRSARPTVYTIAAGCVGRAKCHAVDLVADAD